MRNLTIDETVQERRVRTFLDELTELTKKYQIEIGGCGCCGSPFLVFLDEEPHPRINASHYTVERPDYYEELTYERLSFSSIEKRQIHLFYDDEIKEEQISG